MGMAKTKDKKPVGAAPKPKRQESAQVAPSTIDGKEIRGIVRVAGRDLKGHWKLTRSIQTIKGMGTTLGFVISKIVIKELGLTEKTVIGQLDEHQVEKLEEILSNPKKYGLADYLLNRQREFQSNAPHHLISTDLAYAVKQDIDHEKDSQTWKGYRHSYGQKVRGQRTRSTGRTGMTVGVLRKAAARAAPVAGAAPTAGAAAPAAEAKPKEKEAKK
ncbi:MAG: 30S ribosomal protein S13 [Candidatus Micrarchaeia archaeon]